MENEFPTPSTSEQWKAKRLREIRLRWCQIAYDLETIQAAGTINETMALPQIIETLRNAPIQT